MLFKKEYFEEIISNYNNNAGRVCSFTATKNGDTFLFLNIYAPTEHADAPEFYEKIDDLIETQFLANASIKIVIAGDFNLVINPEFDLIGRTQTR